MRIFKTRWMARFGRKWRISDGMLVEAIRRAERGLIDADLGGGVIKQRVDREGQGRSGGYRTVIAFRSGDRAIFVFAFSKNERDNIGPAELRELKSFAAGALQMRQGQLEIALAAGDIEEIGRAEN